jgi:hypothetical protein
MTGRLAFAPSLEIRDSRPRCSTRLARALLAGAAMLAWAGPCISAPGPAEVAEPPLARSVKAAFLYKFLGYVEWPAGSFSAPDAPIVVGVAGADELATELQQIVAGRSVESRNITVRRVQEGDSLAGLNVLFIARAESGRLAQIARAARQRAILLVSESDHALDQGSIINFVVSEGRIRFEVSLPAAEQSGLKLSSRMLSVAQYVRTGS